MDRVASIVILGLAASYLLRALILIERDSHEGPFRSKTQFVRFPSSGHTQKVALFDWIRRIAGVYKIDNIEWTVREESNSAERFTCPFCLSWWVALPFSMGFAIYTRDWIWVIPAHFAIAIVSQIIYKYLWDSDD